MMKNILVVVSVLALAACSQPKIGFVDNVELMDKYQEKIDVEANFNNKLEALNKKRDSISQSFQLDLQELQAKNLSNKKMQEEYNLLQQRGQFVAQQLQQEEQQLQASGQTEMDSLVSRVRKQIKTYGESNGYTYILGGGEGSAVLYGQDVNDLTEQIVKLLNDSYKK